ncbi:MAG: hypothetical protein L3J81_02700 [Thermoplasmata archaeon]|jgi:hypothetical protein|nr:hypothetical protein [Thermoplasmata archaeon]
MVDVDLTFGAVAGVALSAGFVYWEIGRYAAPQVSESRFDERKEMFAYTAGLFVGIPLAVAFLFFLSAGTLAAAGIDLFALVAGTELAQWLVLRSIYFGSDGSGAFYALGFRAGIGGILTLAIVAQALGAASVTPTSLGVAFVQSGAIVALEVVGALLSLRTSLPSGGPRGGPLPGGLVSGIGFFLIALGPAFGDVGALAAALAVGVVAALMYRRLARPVLSRIRPPSAVLRSDDDEAGAEDRRSGFGRTDR